MPRTCTVCASKHRSAIDRAILAGTSIRAIAARYRVSSSSVSRHATCHVSERLASAHAAAEVADADGLLAELRRLHATTLGILQVAEAGGNGRLALAAVREARGNLELMAKVLGTIEERSRVSVSIDVTQLSDAELEAVAGGDFSRLRGPT